MLVVFTDQQRHDTCGVYGQRLATTPNLDALAADGVVFDEAFCVQPLCGPSRSSVQTGRYPTRTRTFRNDLPLPPGTPTLATRLGALGYETSYIGKWHLASSRGRVDGWDPGPPRLFRDRARPPRVARRLPRPRGSRRTPSSTHVAALRWSRVRRDGRPRRLPGLPASDRLTDMAVGPPRAGGTGDRPRLLFLSYLERAPTRTTVPLRRPRGGRRAFRGFDVPGRPRRHARRLALELPDYLARVPERRRQPRSPRRAPRRAGHPRRDADRVHERPWNHFRTRNAEYKRSGHDASNRVPLVIRGPGFRGGVARGRGMAALVDLVPTIVTAAGGTVAADETDGLDLGGAVAARRVPREELLVQVSESCVGRTLRTEGWKLCTRAPGGRGRRQPAAGRYEVTHLYDLHADPYERRNLARHEASEPSARELADALPTPSALVAGRRRRMPEGGGPVRASTSVRSPQRSPVRRDLLPGGAARATPNFLRGSRSNASRKGR